MSRGSCFTGKARKTPTITPRRLCSQMLLGSASPASHMLGVPHMCSWLQRAVGVFHTILGGMQSSVHARDEFPCCSNLETTVIAYVWEQERWIWIGTVVGPFKLPSPLCHSLNLDWTSLHMLLEPNPVLERWMLILVCVKLCDSEDVLSQKKVKACLDVLCWWTFLEESCGAILRR